MSQPEPLGFLLGCFPPTPAVLQLDPGSELTLGREPNARVVLPFRSVSRRHALLRATDEGRVELLDLGSENGTWWCRARLGETPVELTCSGVMRLHDQVLIFVSREVRGVLPPLPAAALDLLLNHIRWAEDNFRDPSLGGFWPAMTDPIWAGDTLIGASVDGDDAEAACGLHLPEELKGVVGGHLPLPSLLYYLATCVASGTLRLGGDGFSARILFDAGRLIGGRAGRLSGFHALLECASRGPLSFCFRCSSPREECENLQTIPTERLIYETCAHIEGRGERPSPT